MKLNPLTKTFIACFSCVLSIFSGNAQTCEATISHSVNSNGLVDFSIHSIAPVGNSGYVLINYGGINLVEDAQINSNDTTIVFSYNYTANDTFYVEAEVNTFNPVDSAVCTAMVYDTIIITNYSCFVNVTAVYGASYSGLNHDFYAEYSTPPGTHTLSWRIVDSIGTNYLGASNQSSLNFDFPHFGYFKVYFIVNAFDSNTSQTCADSAYYNVHVYDSVFPCNAQASIQITSLGGMDAIFEGNAPGINPTSQYITVDGGTYHTDSMSYTFPIPANWLVCYYAQDTTYPGGCSVSACETYIIPETPDTCEAYFTLEQDSANPTVWHGTNLSNGPSGITYLWDFGDGTTSTLPALTHNYAVPGNYIICLTIADSASNCMSTYCDSSAYFNRPGSTNAIGSLVITAPLVVSVTEHQSLLNKAKLFPNPLTETATITFNSPLAGNGKIEIVNILGSMVTQETILITKGNNEFKLNTAALENGLYYVNITAENRILTTLKAIK
ncbi:MAG TPA: T9SS type A sorting domain-containing protein [Bacteroidia bacterium]